MSLFLAGVPGKLKTLTDRITNSTTPLSDTRVGYLDASIAGRASQTSVNTIDTNVDSILATVTANLDAAVSSAGLPVQQGFSHSGYTVTPSATLSCPGNACGTTWSDNVYKTMVTVSAAGVLHFLGIQRAASVSGTQSIRLTIDGGTPVEFTGTLDATNEVLMAVGVLHTDGSWSLQPLRFTASLLVEIKANVTSGSPSNNWCNYHCLYTLD